MRGNNNKHQTRKSLNFTFKRLALQRDTKVLRRKSDGENVVDEGKVEDNGNNSGKEREY